MDSDRAGDSAFIGPLVDSISPTSSALRKRALELVLMHGGSVTDVSKFERDQALLELTGKPATPTQDDL